jgi:hypothetical protein
MPIVAVEVTIRAGRPLGKTESSAPVSNLMPERSSESCAALCSVTRLSARRMNALSPILRPLFEYNHDIVMRWGAEGLAKLLNVRVESLKGEPLRVAAQALAQN